MALCDVLSTLANGATASPRTDGSARGAGRLDDRSRAFGAAALLRNGGSRSAYQRVVATALSSGMSAEEVVDVLIGVAPTVGLARLVPAAVELAAALGYDIDPVLKAPVEARTPRT